MKDKQFKITWIYLDGTEVLYSPVGNEKAFNSMDECFEYIKQARLRLNVENRFCVKELTEYEVNIIKQASL